MAKPRCPLTAFFSRILVETLCGMTERPSPEVNRGKPITERWLARNLTAFGIKSGNIRIGEKQAKGYERAHFNEAFARYLPDTGDFIRPPPSHTREKTENPSVPHTKLGRIKKTVLRGIGTPGRL